MYKIIFFDIDGTLRDESYGVPQSAKEAIKICKDKGYYLCLCTGRTINTITDDIHKLNMDGIIAGGGSHIEFQSKNIRKKFFDKNHIEILNTYLKNFSKNTAFTFETEDIVFMNKEAVKILTSFNEEKLKSLNEKDKEKIISEQKIVYENNISNFNPNTHKISKICLWSNEDTFKEIRNILGRTEFQLAQSFKFDTRNYYEIIQKECNKGQAITTLCEYLNIPIEKTIAFGDGRNDIDMLKTVALSIGVKNGSKEIFKHVDSICEEPMNDGIYLELKRRNLI